MHFFATSVSFDDELVGNWWARIIIIMSQDLFPVTHALTELPTELPVCWLHPERVTLCRSRGGPPCPL